MVDLRYAGCALLVLAAACGDPGNVPAAPAFSPQEPPGVEPPAVEAPCDLADISPQGLLYFYAEAPAPAETFAVYTCKYQDIRILPAVCEAVDTYTVVGGQALVLCGTWGQQADFIRIEEVP